MNYLTGISKQKRNLISNKLLEIRITANLGRKIIKIAGDDMIDNSDFKLTVPI